MALFNCLTQYDLSSLLEDVGAAGGDCGGSAPQSTSSDSIARTPGKMKRTPMIKRVKLTTKKVKLKENFDLTHSSDILAKLAAVSDSSATEDVRVFGFEDSTGNIIKVTVDATQGEEFKNTLGSLLQDYQENEVDIEVAEVLFNLRHKFNIIDVQWPQYVEDEEPATPPSDNGDSLDDNVDQDIGDDVEAPPPSSGSDSETVSTALDSMLNALIADAEARRQEAVARAAEARAKEAEAAAKMSAQKMAAEEEVADMEAFYNSQNEEQKEAKKLAKLAKYRHQMRKSQQQLRSTAYSNALDDQDDDDFTNIDTAEDADGERPEELTSPVDDIDSALKTADENEERVAPAQTSNLLKALMKYKQQGGK